MNKIINGYLYQEYEPTPDNPCEIKGLNLLSRERDLQYQINFLIERENKLQTIEQMFKSGTVDLEELQKIVEGE